MWIKRYQIVFNWKQICKSFILELIFYLGDQDRFSLYNKRFSFSFWHRKNVAPLPADFQQTFDQKHTRISWPFRQVSQVRLYNSFERCTLGNRRRICFKGIVFTRASFRNLYCFLLFTLYSVCLLLLHLSVCIYFMLFNFYLL